MNYKSLKEENRESGQVGKQQRNNSIKFPRMEEHKLKSQKIMKHNEGRPTPKHMLGNFDILETKRRSIELTIFSQSFSFFVSSLLSA